MNIIINRIGLAWIVLIMFLLLIVDVTPGPEPHTKLFCAYGKVFVEFTEDGNTWGTLMLDDRGLPIPCSSEEKLDTISNTI